MIVTMIKCEGCDKTHEVPTALYPAGWNLPDGWLIVFPGKDPQASEGWHFCSKECLAKWAGVVSAPASIEPPQSEIRRFLLVNGETADIVEGVVWSDGRVSIESHAFSYATWEEFGIAHPGDGVQWIDPEVKVDEN